MNRIQKLKLNSSISILAQIVIIGSGLILPRLILSNYGAETHGLVNSVTQFLAIITFLDLGVGLVVKSALYRPLAERDNKQVSSIIIAAKKYFQNISYILVAYVLILIMIFPLVVDSTIGYFSTIFLIIAISISYFGRYYFGIVNELLLSANQQDYIQLGSEIIVVIFNLLISVLLIYLGADIEIVKLGSGLVYLIRPLFLKGYVKRNFSIDYDIENKENPLPQRWSGIGHHVAYTIQNSTDIIVLTLFSSLENISVYSIYNMVVSAIKILISSLATGVQSFFGDLYASNEISLLNNYFDKVEWIVHTGVIYLYGLASVLINSFVKIYTSGVEGVSYDAPIFSFLLVLASAVYSLRTPYHSMILSAGHFKQTQLSSFIEAGLNLLISIILVTRFGLIGVAIGSLISMTYRTLYLVIYLSRNIVYRSIKKFIKHLFVDIISFGLIIVVGSSASNFYIIENVFDWIVISVVISIISLTLLLFINLIFHNKITISTIKSILNKG